MSNRDLSVPRIYVIARPAIAGGLSSFLVENDLEWRVDQTSTAAERLIEIAGRVCYMAFGRHQSPRTNGEYILNLIESGHESVLEHVSWTFVLTGVSRAFTHQLVRHRIGFSFSQLSQQYHPEDEAAFVRPLAIDSDEVARAIWDEAIASSRDAYRKILDRLDQIEGVPKGPGIKERKERDRWIRSAARSVLPNAVRTVIVVTANARAIRHFLVQRGNIEGDQEMRTVSALLLDSIRDDAPSVFQDFRIERSNDGMPTVRHHKSPSK